MALEQYPKLKPFPGLVFEAYVSHRDIGSGIRLFIVSQTGRKYVYLFDPPKLRAFKIRLKDWNEMYIQPVPAFNGKAFKARIRERAMSFTRLGTQYSEALVKKLLALKLDCGWDKFDAADEGRPVSKPVTTVRRG